MLVIVDYDEGASVPDNKADSFVKGLKDGDSIGTECLLYAVRYAVCTGVLPEGTELYLDGTSYKIDPINGKLSGNYTSPINYMLTRAMRL